MENEEKGKVLVFYGNKECMFYDFENLFAAKVFYLSCAGREVVLFEFNEDNNTYSVTATRKEEESDEN